MANATGFYTFHDPVFPPGQKIVTQLPKEIALTRIIATLFFTACVIAKTGWSWPVVIFGIGFAAYTAYKHLIVEDPLVDAMYPVFGYKLVEKKDAGGHKFLEKVSTIENEFQLDPNKSLHENITAIKWDELEHQNYKAVTPDGRKMMIVKGKSNPHSSRGMEEVMVFVEKLGPLGIPFCDNLWRFQNKRLLSLLAALGFFGLENPFSVHQYSGNTQCSSKKWNFYAHIPTDMANEFIEQRTKRKD